MKIFKALKIRKENKIKDNIERQSRRKECCESCKYCYESDSAFGYTYYNCFLKEPNFNGCDDDIYMYKCENYKPCRKYRKYLEMKEKCLV